MTWVNISMGHLYDYSNKPSEKRPIVPNSTRWNFKALLFFLQWNCYRRGPRPFKVNSADLDLEGKMEKCDWQWIHCCISVGTWEIADIRLGMVKICLRSTAASAVMHACRNKVWSWLNDKMMQIPPPPPPPNSSTNILKERKKKSLCAGYWNRGLWWCDEIDSSPQKNCC